MPDLATLEAAWSGSVLGTLTNRARARFNAGRFVAVDAQAEFALPNAIHRDRCDELRPEVEAALAAHFGRPVPLRLVVDGESGPSQGPLAADTSAPAPSRGAGSPSPIDDDPHDMSDIGDISELDDADVATSSVERLTQLFPGAEVIEE